MPPLQVDMGATEDGGRRGTRRGGKGAQARARGHESRARFSARSLRGSDRPRPRPRLLGFRI